MGVPPSWNAKKYGIFWHRKKLVTLEVPSLSPGWLRIFPATTRCNRISTGKMNDPDIANDLLYCSDPFKRHSFATDCGGPATPLVAANKIVLPYLTTCAFIDLISNIQDRNVGAKPCVSHLSHLWFPWHFQLIMDDHTNWQVLDPEPCQAVIWINHGFVWRLITS